MVIGYGNGLMFREVNGLLPSFDNTFLADEAFINTMIYDYCSKAFAGRDLVIQAKVPTGDVPTMGFVDSNGLSGVVAGALVSSYTDYDFYEFTKTMGAAGTSYYFTASNAGDDDWKSENITVVEDDGSYTLFEWFNLDPTTGRANNNFEMDYSTGIVPWILMRVIFKDYEPKSEISVYENLDETTKLKEKVQRTISLQTDVIPRYMGEKLTIITAHDNLYLNEVAFVREDKAEVDNSETNLCEFSAILTQQNVIGLNTSDIGFNCDSIVATDKVQNLKELGVSGNTSFDIPEDFLLHTITCSHNSGIGTNTLCEFGRTIGGDEIATINVSPNSIGVYKNKVKTVTKHIEYTPDGDVTSKLYVEISGATPNVDIYIQLIDNKT